MIHQRFLFVLLLATVFPLVVACTPKGPSVRMVTGTVTMDGRIVSDADVCFTPKDSGHGVPAVGKTDSNGVYQLTSAQGGEFGKGAVEGGYNVRIMKYRDLDFVEPENAQIGAYLPMARPRHHLPERYADVKTSGLSATVKKGENTIDFELTFP